jgi:hypothetical protein
LRGRFARSETCRAQACDGRPRDARLLDDLGSLDPGSDEPPREFVPGVGREPPWLAGDPCSRVGLGLSGFTVIARLGFAPVDLALVDGAGPIGVDPVNPAVAVIAGVVDGRLIVRAKVLEAGGKLDRPDGLLERAVASGLAAHVASLGPAVADIADAVDARRG